MNPTLNWLKKGASLKTLAWPTGFTFNFEPQLSYGDPQADNLMIQGDNLDVLKVCIPVKSSTDSGFNSSTDSG